MFQPLVFVYLCPTPTRYVSSFEACKILKHVHFQPLPPFLPFAAIFKAKTKSRWPVMFMNLNDNIFLRANKPFPIKTKVKFEHFRKDIISFKDQLSELIDLCLIFFRT